MHPKKKKKFPDSPFFGLQNTITKIKKKRGPSTFEVRAPYQSIAVAAVLVLVLLLDLPFYLLIDKPLNQTGCVPLSYEIGQLLSIWTSVITNVIPASIMIVFTALTTSRLIKRRMNLNKNHFKKEKRYFKVLLWLNIYLIICYLPYSILRSYNES